jgi:hypothetical protein
MSINKIFRVESKLMVWLLLAPFVIGFVIAVFGPWIFHQSMSVDSCLDSGGSYNYDQCTCDHEKSHPSKKA